MLGCWAARLLGLLPGIALAQYATHSFNTLSHCMAMRLQSRVLDNTQDYARVCVP